ncbi:rnapii degradation factor [Grosmannia clavigera kw1407]|uniref:RNA polymerase II degradation factor 1 n=1 Tax=Grosmannia clavigera (strain kw1407 / UAMH 11150) TaxID=655863 RepID=F0XPD2_GROCL|nr:rnapii degradation factor [Grosmannia clavigera kw1407]EFX00372.1 rnapii degradation factor [Grosmannia clavigera kw1407]
MSTEPQTRPTPSRGGRGASRGGRGGFGSRGSTRNRDRPAGATNGDAPLKHDDSLAGIEDEGEIGQLKKLYGAKTSLIKEMFTDWSEVDILFALRETDGDENLTVTRIAEGTISQWDEVSKPKKERAKPKPSAAGESAPGSNSRTGRTTGAAERTRGRARTVERGGRTPRGRSAQPTNGTRPEKTQLSVPTEESRAWESNPESNDDSVPPNTTPALTTNEPASTPAPTPKTTAPESTTPAPKTWASMLRQSAAPKPVVKPKETPPVPKPAPETIETPPSQPATAAVASAPTEAEPEPVAEPEEPAQPAVKEEVAIPEVAVPAVAIPDVAVAPSQDKLTESNLERVTDTSTPLTTDTIRSEAADSWDTRGTALAGTSSPAPATQPAVGSLPKNAGSGFATSALKATDRAAVRTPSYSRRVLDQEEAVRMPVNREVDRATVQFGALNFSGGDDDIDGDREEPETRAQPPDDSPTAHPRAALPPAIAPSAVSDTFAAQRPAAPAATASVLPPTGPAGSHTVNVLHAGELQTNTLSAAVPSVPQQAAPSAAQAQSVPAAQPYGRFAQETAFAQKPFDAYGQPAATPPFDSFQNVPASSQPQAQAQQAQAAYSSAPGDYSQYYTSADAQSRVPFNYYNQAYGQHAAQGHQDALQNQRPYGGYPLNDSLNQYPQSNASRFGAAAAGAAAPVVADAQNSGSTTPNPPAPGQPQQAQQPGAVQNGQAQSQQQPQASQYPYNHPYFTSPYYNQYMNQMNQYGSFAQGNFGPYGKGYGNHHPGYGVTPTPYEHNISQASTFAAGSSLHRGAETNSLATGLGEYGRVGSGQPSSYGSGHDGSFGRAGAAAYQAQAGQGFGAPPSQASAQQAGADDLKPYGDPKGATGPSPSLGGARPGSATNTQASQPGLPPPQSSQQGISSYGGYPTHLQGHSGLHGNQSVAGGGYGMSAGANQSHTNNPYGGYGGHGGHGQGFAANSYYANQQQRGWGGNYH